MGKALTVTELADYLGLAKDTIYRKARADEIPGVRIGRSWRFLQDVIDEWLRKERQTTSSKKDEGGGIIGGSSRKNIDEDRLTERRLGSGGKSAKGKTTKLPISELKRRQRLVRRILETREVFEKLPMTADEAYRISRRDLERRSSKWN